MYEKVRQTSESFKLGVILALSAGCQDAYTYIVRGRVFANAQTGNIVLMSQSIIEKHWGSVLTYLLPLIAFAIGIFLAEQIGGKLKNISLIHWRQIVILIELTILSFVGILPNKYDVMATILVSLVCALQVQSFRKVDGNPYASTMCVGNLRSGTAAVSAYLRTKNKQKMKQARYYYGIILAFATGAAISTALCKTFGIKTIWVSSFLLLIGFLMMFEKQKEG